MQIARARAMDTQSEEHPIRQEVRKLCETYALSAVFSEDTLTLATLKTPGLIAVKCVLSKDGKPVGVGHGSSTVSRINRGIERTIFSCLNGALMSAVNSACKSLDVMRLESSQERLGTTPSAGGYFPKAAEDAGDQQITAKQKELLTSLIYQHIGNEDEQERRLQEVESLCKSDAGEMISNLLAASRR
jgi:hypothetical protein